MTELRQRSRHWNIEFTADALHASAHAGVVGRLLAWDVIERKYLDLLALAAQGSILRLRPGRNVPAEKDAEIPSIRGNAGRSCRSHQAKGGTTCELKS